MALSSFIGQKLSFDTVAPGILGATRTGARLAAMLDLDTVKNFSDVQAKHAQVRNVDNSLPVNAGSYMYGKFIYADGSVEYIGEPWIKASSIKAVVTRKLIFTIDENVTDETETLARAAWAQNGITAFKVEVVQ
jgi:hypothetical protein